MRVRLVKIGKLALPVDPLINTYAKRLQAIAKVELSYLKSNDQLSKSLSDEKTRRQSYVVLLDERGSQFSSPALADFLRKKTDDAAVKTLLFVVGGPFGFDRELREKADLVWKLSEGVFPSDLAWVLLCEQIYRAYSILLGTSYHHE